MLILTFVVLLTRVRGLEGIGMEKEESILSSSKELSRN
jgi:hypothetical protein